MFKENKNLTGRHFEHHQKHGMLPGFLALVFGRISTGEEGKGRRMQGTEKRPGHRQGEDGSEWAFISTVREPDSG